MGDFPNANDVTEADQSEGGYAHRHSLLVGSLETIDCRTIETFRNRVFLSIIER